MYWSRRERAEIWIKNARVEGWKIRVFQRDAYGRRMKFDEHGRKGVFGWEVDHIIPESLGGPNEIYNLRPLHWRSNREKGDSVSRVDLIDFILSYYIYSDYAARLNEL